MSSSKLLDEIRIHIAPYIRSGIVGYQNRLGNGSFYQSRVNENTYILNGKETVIESENEKNYLIIAAFAEKFMKREIGRTNKKDDTLDSLIAEIIYVLKYNEMSTEYIAQNIFENEILNDPSFKEAQQAFQNLEAQGSLSESLQGSSIEGFDSVVGNGRYGEIISEIKDLEAKLASQRNNMSPEEIANVESQIKQKKEEAETIKRRERKQAKEYLSENQQKEIEIKAKISDLVSTMKNTQKGSPEYVAAKTELEQISKENSQLIETRRIYNSATLALREVRRMGNFAPSLQEEGLQPGQ